MSKKWHLDKCPRGSVLAQERVKVYFGECKCMIWRMAYAQRNVWIKALSEEVKVCFRALVEEMAEGERGWTAVRLSTWLEDALQML